MIEIVIDIPEEMYERIKDGYVPLGISKYLKNGTPLPKGHGRLIDADEAREVMMYRMSGTGFQCTAMDVFSDLYTPTIIEADGGE